MLDSLRHRVILASALWVTVALGVSFILLSELFRRQVTELFEEELRGHYEELIGLAELDEASRPRLRHSLNDPRFEKPAGGFFWELRIGPGGESLRSPSLGGHGSISASGSVVADGKSLWPGDGPAGPVLMVVGEKLMPAGTEAMKVILAANTTVVEDVLHRFDDELRRSLAVLGVGLIGAAWMSVAFGFRPLRRVRAALKAVHSGSLSRLPGGLPREVAELADDVNRLIQANAETVRRARAETGRLAHGLKTPLAIMLAEARRLEGTENVVIGRAFALQCERMQRQIEYQLSRSRSGAVAATQVPGNSTRIGRVAREVIIALSALHRERDLDFALEGDLEALVACDSEDVHEILGNLLDNAAKWTRKQIVTSITASEKMQVEIRIEDDGPGLPEGTRERAFDAGARLDETRPGSGLGLAIVRDVVAKYGGRAWMERSALGGAKACVTLPAAPSVW